MTTTAAVDVICQQFEASCVDLFNSLDCAIARQDIADADMSASLVAIIDAGSEDLEVIIVLHMPLAVLTMTYPEFAAESIMDVSEEVLEDWILELANQLVGRFKNKMVSLDCRMKIGLPSMYYRASDAHLPTHGHELHQFMFDVDKEIVGCGLYLQIFNPDLHFSAPAEDGGAGEGELELF